VGAACRRSAGRRSTTSRLLSGIITGKNDKGVDSVSKKAEVERVKQVLTSFFAGLNTRDNTTVREIWHPDARLFLNNALLNTRHLSFLLSLPESMDFRIQAIKHIDIAEAIANARVDYSLSVGHHAGFFNLVKVDGKWLIANWVDHGVERQTHAS
jgi:hypothetical protein